MRPRCPSKSLLELFRCSAKANEGHHHCHKLHFQPDSLLGWPRPLSSRALFPKTASETTLPGPSPFGPRNATTTTFDASTRFVLVQGLCSCTLHWGHALCVLGQSSSFSSSSSSCLTTPGLGRAPPGQGTTSVCAVPDPDHSTCSDSDPPHPTHTLT